MKLLNLSPVYMASIELIYVKLPNTNWHIIDAQRILVSFLFNSPNSSSAINSICDFEQISPFSYQLNGRIISLYSSHFSWISQNSPISNSLVAINSMFSGESWYLQNMSQIFLTWKTPQIYSSRPFITSLSSEIIYVTLWGSS